MQSIFECSPDFELRQFCRHSPLAIVQSEEFASTLSPMRAITQRKYGSFDVFNFEEVNTPEPGPGEVRVRVHAAAVNDWEMGLMKGNPLLMRLYLGLFRPKRVRIPGCDVAGTVEKLGSQVSRFKLGDKVYGDLSDTGFGAFAEYVCVEERALGFMPSNLSFEQAAAIPHAAMLAYQGLQELGGLQQGMSVLINGAGGGVGVLALQYAKMLKCRVAGVDAYRKQTYLHLVGFDECIDYEKEDFTQRGKQYDLILDVKTTRSPFAYLRALKPGGKYITVGGDSGLIILVVLLGKWIAWRHGMQVRVLGLKPNQGLKEFTGLIEAGKFLPAIDKRYPLKEFPMALKRFAEARQEGKIIIRVLQEEVLTSDDE